ncbi:hypothetical protein CsatB_024106 [Cannabis sativa]
MAAREANQEPESTMVARPMCVSVPVRKKKKKRNHGRREVSLLDSMLTDDSLMEIFLRLHDSRALFQCGPVCKRWLSIITSIEFRQQQLVRLRSLSQSFSFTLLIRVENLTMTAPFCELLCDERGQMSSSEGYLDFLPWTDIQIYAAYGDLLLLGRHEKTRFFIICNPFTKQWIKLPKPPISYKCYSTHGGLVLSDDYDPNNITQLDQIRYKVLIIWHVDFGRTIPYKSMTFCSEAGEWSKLTQFSLEIGGHINSQITPLVSNGILHWAEQDSEWGYLYRIVAFDPFKDIYHPKHCRFIDFPSDFLVGLDFSCDTMVRLGLVRGRLHLSQLIKTEGDGFVMKIWELRYRNDSNDGENDVMWYLVHNVIERKWSSKKWCVIGLHPDDENVVFLLRGRRRVYRYNIDEQTKEKVCKLKKDGSRYFPSCLCISTLVHPLWPTPISSLKF